MNTNGSTRQCITKKKPSILPSGLKLTLSSHLIVTHNTPRKFHIIHCSKVAYTWRVYCSYSLTIIKLLANSTSPCIFITCFMYCYHLHSICTYTFLQLLNYIGWTPCNSTQVQLSNAAFFFQQVVPIRYHNKEVEKKNSDSLPQHKFSH